MAEGKIRNAVGASTMPSARTDAFRACLPRLTALATRSMRTCPRGPPEWRRTCWYHLLVFLVLMLIGVLPRWGPQLLVGYDPSGGLERPEW